MYTYRTKGVCSRAINVEVEGDTISNMSTSSADATAT